MARRDVTSWVNLTLMLMHPPHSHMTPTAADGIDPEALPIPHAHTLGTSLAPAWDQWGHVDPHALYQALCHALRW